jgi:hypothetical protein
MTSLDRPPRPLRSQILIKGFARVSSMYRLAGCRDSSCFAQVTRAREMRSRHSGLRTATRSGQAEGGSETRQQDSAGTAAAVCGNGSESGHMGNLGAGWHRDARSRRRSISLRRPKERWCGSDDIALELLRAHARRLLCPLRSLRGLVIKSSAGGLLLHTKFIVSPSQCPRAQPKPAAAVPALALL